MTREEMSSAAPAAKNRQVPWWQRGIIYQIYPRSFTDASGDGVGDLPGVLSRLDYLESLHIDAVWLSPVYPSPMADFGYDISDYRGIDPLFGTMDDFDRLLQETHRRGLRLIMDFVPNHTSDRHPWFLESRSSRDNPKRDWYIWRDPAPGGGPPNNWVSYFGGPAWAFDDQTGQYYLHLFLKEQPDLNYRHPDVLPAMLDVMRFWLEKGVDGFRVDVILVIAKDEELRDEPPNPEFKPGEPPHRSLLHIYSRDLPRVHDYIRVMRRVVEEYENRVMIGEIYLPLDRLLTYYGVNLDECHLPFNFQLLLTKWEAKLVRRIVEAYEASLPRGAWPNWVLGNHDRSRIASRVGRAQARVACLLLLTLRGTPTCYYGDEIGMVDVNVPAEKRKDPAALRQPGVDGAYRDPERTPMQWDDGPNAGFCPQGTEPWLPIADDWRTFNVAGEELEPRSTLSFFRRLTALRREEPALNIGSYSSFETGDDSVYAYERRHEKTRLLIALNFGQREKKLDFKSAGRAGRVILSTSLDREGAESLASFPLRGDEGVILLLDDEES